jgi:hypothetical protein
MARIDRLKVKVVRTIRLAKAILDRKIAEWLQASAAECRAELQVLSLKAAA